MENIIAEVSVDERGRYLEINGENFDIYELAYQKYPSLDPEDEDVWALATMEVEDELLHRLGVTHMVSVEDFDSEDPEPISKLFDIGQKALKHISKADKERFAKLKK